jgi:hypothetical protein
MYSLVRKQQFGVLLLLAIACMLTVFYLPFLTNRASFFIFDLFAAWQPELTYIGDRVAAGQMPLWNPYLANGIPQMGVLTPNIFYPPNLLFAVLPFNPALAIVLIAQQLLAAASAFWIARSFGWGMWAAGIAGVSAGLSGLMFSLQPTPTLMGTIAWFLASWYLIRAIGNGTAAEAMLRTAGAIFSVYCMITAGVSEIFSLGLLFLGIVSVADFRSNHRRFGRRAGWILYLRIAALVLAIAMACPVLLPVTEWTRLSVRSFGLPLNEIFTFSCNWYDLLCMLVTHPLGDMYAPDNPFRAVATSGQQMTYLSGAYVGPVVATLAFWALADRSFRWRWLCVFAVVFGLLVSLGSNMPGLVSLVDALNLRLFRYPVKALVPVVLILIFLASRGMQMFIHNRPLPGTFVLRLLWFLSMVVGLALMFAGISFGAAHQLGIGAGGQKAFLMLRLCGQGLLISSFIGLLCTDLSRYRIKGLRFSRLSAAFMLAMSIALFAVDVWKFDRHLGPADFYQRPSLVEQQIKTFVGPNEMLPRAAILYQAPNQPLSAIGRGSVINEVYNYSLQMLAPQSCIPRKIDDVSDFVLGQTADHDLLWRKARREFLEGGNSVLLDRMCRITNASLVVMEAGKIGKDGMVKERYTSPDRAAFSPILDRPDMNLSIYSVKRALPRAYFAKTIEWDESHAHVMSKLANNTDVSFDPGQTTILESAPDSRVATSSSDGAAIINVASEAPEIVRVAVDTKTDNYLVLTDQYYPGWISKVDGVRTKIVRANGLFRAVFVPSGKHDVVFEFKPTMFTIGVVLHIIAWLAIIKLLVLSLLVRRQPE